MTNHKAYKRNILISFSISLLMLIASSAASWYSIENLLDSDQWVKHTTAVISRFDYILSKIKDAETGQRGYLLTSDKVFLEPYTGAKAIVFDTIDSVRELTADNAEQQEDFPKLLSLVKTKFELMEGTISRNEQGYKVQVNELLTGKKVMDDLRRQIKIMTGREQLLMVSRTQKMNRFITYTPVLIVLASLLSLVLTIVFSFRVNRDAVRYAALQQALVAKQAETERQIGIVDAMAKKIVQGDYRARIHADDLYAQENGQKK